MSATSRNTTPIYSGEPDLQWGNDLATANTALDGTGTVKLVYTAPTDGGFVQKLKIRHLGTNIATVLRIFLNNGSTNATRANNVLLDEITIPANTVSQTAASVPQEIPLNIAVPGGYKLNCTVGTTIAAGIDICAVAGKY